MKRTPLFQAATAALLLSLGCSPDDLAHEDPTLTPTPEPAPSPNLPTSPPHEAHGSPDAPCRLDADCGPSTFCELRICITGCLDDSACNEGELCSPHGRCEPQGRGSRPIPPVPRRARPHQPQHHPRLRTNRGPAPPSATTAPNR
jgi:hypothetical protein